MTREQFDTELMKGIESMNELQENLYSRRPVSDLRLHAFGLEALDPVDRIQEEIRPLDFMPARYTIMIGVVEKHKLY